jgi:hypothetical protein
LSRRALHEDGDSEKLIEESKYFVPVFKVPNYSSPEYKALGLSNEEIESKRMNALMDHVMQVKKMKADRSNCMG